MNPRELLPGDRIDCEGWEYEVVGSDAEVVRLRKPNRHPRYKEVRLDSDVWERCFKIDFGTRPIAATFLPKSHPCMTDIETAGDCGLAILAGFVTDEINGGQKVVVQEVVTCPLGHEHEEPDDAEAVAPSCVRIFHRADHPRWVHVARRWASKHAG